VPTDQIADFCRGSLSLATEVQATAKLVRLTVVGATQTNGAENWAAVKKRAADVFVEATTAPNNKPDEWKQIKWSGDTGKPVAGQPNRRRLSRAVSKKFHVEAALGGVSHYVDVWILWATIEIMTNGVRPPNAAPFPPTRDDTDKLGAVTWLTHIESVIDEEAGVFVRNMGASGKVAPVATLSPKGIHAVVKSGWGFKREGRTHEWQDTGQRRMDGTWIGDTTPLTDLRLTPDLDDHIYDRDAPDIRWGQWSFETYNNFQQWIEWNNEKCSELALWYWQARWRLHKDPRKQITLNDLGTGNITLPSKQFFTVLSRFDLKGVRSIPGGDSIEATLMLYQKASAGGVLVTVTSNHPEAVSPQSPVQVPAGQDSTTFAIATQPVDADLNFMLTATVFGPGDRRYGGGTVKAAQVLKVLLPPKTPEKKRDNIGTILLTGRAGPHTQITLSNPFPPIVDHPVSIDVPFRATQVDFKYETGEVPGDRQGSIVASLNGSVVTAWTTVVKP
jgi:hypothetical protein